MQKQKSGGLRFRVATLAAAWFACSPESVMRGIPAAGSGGATSVPTAPGSGGGGAPGVGGGSSGGAPSVHGGSTGLGGTVSSGGYTYVPPTSVGSGGATSVSWTTPPIVRDAGVAPICRAATAPASGPQSRILMVVKSISSPGTIPAQLKAHLGPEGRGFKVDYAFIYTSTYKTDAGSFTNLWFLDDEKTKIVDVSQYGLAIISKDGYKSGANLDTIPVLCGNNQTADSALAMATSDGTTSPTKSAFTLIDAKHPIAAEKTGDLAGTVLLETGSTANMKIMLAAVPSTARMVGIDWGTTAPGTSAAALFAYDVGDPLANGSAAKARRVGFFLDDSTSWGLVTAGSIAWELFDASVDWLLGLVPCSGAAPASADKDASALPSDTNGASR